ncbi:MULTISPECIES: hypothetical protein [unclassified Streptococcus]|uniref:hypothetical protein n=1 Tax=unclassified Streptococcus TaxID=2608887 RepID=UPI0011B4709A|nr:MULTISPECIES: hypothetical protein [unclassified Streptococcus]TWS94829.1 hypothetical protein FRX52_02615 [Streptococcus sp. sy018]TWT11292.1 hypothetical protein FRX54_03330 [Streptococcus sp. sy004]TWT16277.1 hypothetical protein FRX51_03045 [Streptococcus sp. sy010]
MKQVEQEIKELTEVSKASTNVSADLIAKLWFSLATTLLLIFACLSNLTLTSVSGILVLLLILCLFVLGFIFLQLS